MALPLLADLPVEPNVIIVFAMVIFAAVKALLEKAQKGRAEEAQHQEHFEDDETYDPYQEYEAELERQRAQMDISLPAEVAKKASPPPMPSTEKPTAQPVSLAQPVRPSLTAAEKSALENLQLHSPSKRRASSKSLSRNRLNTLLGSPTAARDALLLSEILGPPKALKGEES